MPAHRPSGLRVAIVGLGPAGAYAASHLLTNPELGATVDAFERLPTPWGLVRSGVAPDHPHIKSVSRVYEKTADHPGFTLHGNVEVGRDITRAELLAHYDAVIYAVGTPGDRPLEIPGEQLTGSAAATDFVGWYNGHPDHRDRTFDLSCRRAVVIGNGNVALDVARMLTLAPGRLAQTDAADHAIAALAQSRIEEVLVIGRRGPEQAAFTHPELRELGQLPGVGLAVDPNELAIPHDFRASRPSKTAQRNLALLIQYAQRSAAAPAAGSRRIALRFLFSPVRIVGDGRVEGVEVVRNRLQRRPDGSLRAVATDATAVIPAGLVLRAVGYRGVPIPGVPFDERRGLIAHEGGRILGPDGAPTREYVVGWAKRGPSGVIGTNKKCALETVRTLVQDLVVGRLDGVNGRPGLPPRLQSRRRDIVGLDEWRAIDGYERAGGERAGRPRVKLTRVADMLAVIDGGRLRDATAAERLAALLGEDQPASGRDAAISASASHSRSASAGVV
jgi:ferredoxin--NADP+ reductase